MSVASAEGFVGSTGRRMTDDRPRPEYGEYATPEQQAAAMGRAYIPPPVPETRVAIPVVPGSPQPSAAEQLRLGGNAIDRFATIFQLGIGLVFLANSDFFHLGEALNAASSELGVGTTVPTTIDHLGWLILTVNIVLYLATGALAYLRLRRGKLAFFVPVIGAAAFYAFLSILIGVLTHG
jgi:hypothetical protein